VSDKSSEIIKKIINEYDSKILEPNSLVYSNIENINMILIDMVEKNGFHNLLTHFINKKMNKISFITLFRLSLSEQVKNKLGIIGLGVCLPVIFEFIYNLHFLLFVKLNGFLGDLYSILRIHKKISNGENIKNVVIFAGDEHISRCNEMLEILEYKKIDGCDNKMDLIKYKEEAHKGKLCVNVTDCNLLNNGFINFDKIKFN
jgi:hypothetical protein